MQEQQLNRNTEADTTVLSACKLSPLLQLAQTRGHRKMRIALPTVPRRQLCPADRATRAALLAAELAAWQMTGGDVLQSSLATDFIRVYQTPAFH